MMYHNSSHFDTRLNYSLGLKIEGLGFRIWVRSEFRILRCNEFFHIEISCTYRWV
jgi:hypothetical protein